MLESYAPRSSVIDIDDETQCVMIDQAKNIVQSHHEITVSGLSPFVQEVTSGFMLGFLTLVDFLALSTVVV